MLTFIHYGSRGTKAAEDPVEKKGALFIHPSVGDEENSAAAEERDEAREGNARVK